jgi:hypothetical protein
LDRLRLQVVLMVSIPADLVSLLSGRPGLGVSEQAFPLLTVDENGYPHVALLSRAEIEVGTDAAEILAVVTSRRTGANLRRDGRAGLIAVNGMVAYYVKLRVARMLEAGKALGCAMIVTEYKADSLGIPLQPISFVTTAEVAQMEGWDVSERLLRELAGA